MSIPDEGDNPLAHKQRVLGQMAREAKAKKLYLLTLMTSDGAYWTFPPSDDFENLVGAQEHLLEAFPNMKFEIMEIKDV